MRKLQVQFFRGSKLKSALVVLSLGDEDRECLRSFFSVVFAQDFSKESLKAFSPHSGLA
jgi:hypothetical protein